MTKIFQKYIYLTFLFLLLFTDQIASQSTGKELTYFIEKEGYVSINIYDSTGNIERILLSGAKRLPGTHTEYWDGLDDDGKASPIGTYTWKLLQTPGLKAKYLMSVGTTLPDGIEREHGLGNQASCSGLDYAKGSIYAVSPGAENVRRVMKMTLDGELVWNGGWEFGNIAVLEDTCYYIFTSKYFQKNQIMAGPSDGSIKDRVNTNDSLGYQIDTSIVPYSDYRGMDFDVSQYDGKKEMLISYKEAGYIQWLNPSNWTELDTAIIPSPRGVAYDSNGAVLVISDTNVIRLSLADKTKQTIITGLSDPYRIAVDSTN